MSSDPQKSSADLTEQLKAELERLRFELALEKANSQSIEESNRLYREIFSKAVNGIMILTEEGQIIDVNNEIQSMLGYMAEELVTFNLADISMPEDFGTDDDLVRDLLEGRRTYYNIEKRYVRNDGIPLWMLLTAFVIKIDSEKRVLINMLEDISARKSDELHLKHVSSHDSLTGVYNRSYFDSEFICLQSGMLMPVSIIVIDIDGLKQINDTKGHDAGDFLIKNVARVLKEAVRGDDLLARIGGDEFSILLPETDEHGAHAVVEHLRKCQQRFNAAQPEYAINFSMGMATAIKGSDIPATFKRADELMYADKQQRKGAAKAD
jgi:diguanylate cyclase (GGDEF)-like protein/PAS domain S-box-containing protein